MKRAYSLLEVREVGDATRTITGIATTPKVDSYGDIVDPMGVQYRGPVNLFLYHQQSKPVGNVEFGKATKAGIPFKINSGFRCHTHNKNVGGKITSSHTRGLAVDIAYANGLDGIKILKALTPYFDRIGVGSNFIHVDIDPDKPSPVMWTY